MATVDTHTLAHLAQTGCEARRTPSLIQRLRAALKASREATARRELARQKLARREFARGEFTGHAHLAADLRARYAVDRNDLPF